MGEPAENPAPPKKRRRRWLIVAFLLVLVSGVAWWKWWRNAKFVGRWQAVDLRNVDPLGEITFDSDGTAVFKSIFGRSVCFRWRVLGDELRLVRFSKLEPTLSDRMAFRITALVPFAARIDPSMNVPAFEGTFHVSFVDSEQLEIRHIAGESEFERGCTLRRIPE